MARLTISMESAPPEAGNIALTRQSSFTSWQGILVCAWHTPFWAYKADTEIQRLLKAENGDCKRRIWWEAEPWNWAQVGLVISFLLVTSVDLGIQSCLGLKSEKDWLLECIFIVITWVIKLNGLHVDWVFSPYLIVCVFFPIGFFFPYLFCVYS